MPKAKLLNNEVSGGPPFKIPGHLSFGQYVIDKFKDHAREGGIALIDGETGTEITYKTLLQKTVNIANGLKKKLGVKRGDVVALCSENRYEYVMCTIGVICCGATLTTANVQYTKDEMKHVLNLSKPNIIICSESSAKLHMPTLKTLKFLKNIIQFDGQPVDKSVLLYNDIATHINEEEFEADYVACCSDVALLLYSSGTTGLPKGVMLSHLNTLNCAGVFENEDKTEPDLVARVLTVVPWYHSLGLLTTIYYLAINKTLIYFSGFNPQKYLNAIQQYKVNLLITAPPIVVFLAKSSLLEKYDLSSVSLILCGSAPLSIETITAARKRLPNCIAIYQIYGMTETLVATKDNIAEKIKEGSAGYPVCGVKIKVVDIKTRMKLGAYLRGEVCLRGPLIMKGYVGNDAATRDIIDEDGYLKTGDIGYYDEEGCFFIVDRLKELIKYKGNQVPPAEVESVLLEHPAVAECGVVGKPDEAAGELPTAFVVIKPGMSATEEELQSFIASKLSVQKRLHGGVIFVQEIPKNPSGKILRRVLRQTFSSDKKII